MYKRLINNYNIPNKFLQVLWVNASVLLRLLILSENSLLMSKDIEKEWDYFYQEKGNLTNNSSLKRTKLDNWRKKLEELWIIDVKLGEGKKMCFSINNETLIKIFFPDINTLTWRQDFLDLFQENEWYTTYHVYLSSIIWSNESIFLEYLIKKEIYFNSKWQIKNWYFFRSTNAVKNDIWLSRDQQQLTIKKLLKEKIIDIEYWSDNKRYFKINKDIYKEVILKGSLKKVESSKSVEWKEKAESSFSLEYENISESWKPLEENPNTESWNIVDQKVDNTYSRKDENNIDESSFSVDIYNNNNKNNNNKKNNNKIKMLLLDIWIFEKKVDELINKFSDEKIEEAIKFVKGKNWNIPWYIISYLENWYKIITEKDQIKYKEKVYNEKLEKERLEELKKKERNKVIDTHVDKWINKNNKKFNDLLEKEKEKTISKLWNIKNIDLLIKCKVRKYIKEKYIKELS